MTSHIVVTTMETSGPQTVTENPPIDNMQLPYAVARGHHRRGGPSRGYSQRGRGGRRGMGGPSAKYSSKFEKIAESRRQSRQSILAKQRWKLELGPITMRKETTKDGMKQLGYARTGRVYSVPYCQEHGGLSEMVCKVEPDSMPGKLMDNAMVRAAVEKLLL